MQAAVAAREGRVAVYNLAETAQEFLTQLLPPETPKHDAEPPLPEVLSCPAASLPLQEERQYRASRLTFVTLMRNVYFQVVP